jgi:hypothetical protein
MDRPAAHGLKDGVAGFLQPQPAFGQVAVVADQRDRVRVAQEVRRVQQVNVQRVAGDPFAAIQQPAQRRDAVVDTDRAGVLDCLPGTGLVGDGADAADA